MSSIWEYEERVVAEHEARKPFAPENGEPLKFGVGDIVAFTNEYGVMFRGLKVTGFYKPEPIDSLYATGRRYLLDWSSPWFPAKESSLQFDSEVGDNPEGVVAYNPVKHAKSVLDPRQGFPVTVDVLPKNADGFVLWNGELREVLDEHRTQSGVQIELVA